MANTSTTIAAGPYADHDSNVLLWETFRMVGNTCKCNLSTGSCDHCEAVLAQYIADVDATLASIR